MLRSLTSARSGMVVQQNKLEVLANNPANSATSGFKRMLTIFEQGADSPQAPPGALRPAGPQPGLATDAGGMGVRVRTGLDVTQGSLEATGNPADVALSGPGFFVVQTPEGQRFTRAGNFHLDPENRLVTMEGHPVLGEGGPLEIPVGSFQIAEDGNLTVNGDAVGRLRVVDFEDPTQLRPSGGNLFTAPEEMAPQAIGAGDTTVVQGFLERSNIDPVRELVALITAQRMFEASQRVLTSEDQSLGKAVNEMARVR